MIMGEGFINRLPLWGRKLYLGFVRMAHIATHCKNAVAPMAHDYGGQGCPSGAVKLYLGFVRMAHIASHCKNAVAPTAHSSMAVK
jgi:hypothetical protein